MLVKVVDTSTIAALVFGEPEARFCANRLSGARLAAPELLPFEIASVCLKKLRRHPDKRQELLSAHRLYERMEISLVKVDLHEVVLMGDRTGLTAYDASYLWLARRLDAELVTLDQQLAHLASEN